MGPEEPPEMEFLMREMFQVNLSRVENHGGRLRMERLPGVAERLRMERLPGVADNWWEGCSEETRFSTRCGRIGEVAMMVFAQMLDPMFRFSIEIRRMRIQRSICGRMLDEWW